MRTLALVDSLLNESLASTSVETRPGTIAKISFPNSTSYYKNPNADHVSSEPRSSGDPVIFHTHQTVGSVLNLSVEVTALLLSVSDGGVDQPSVSGLAGSSEDK